MHTELWGVFGPGCMEAHWGGPQESMFTPTLGKTFLIFEGELAALKLGWLPESSGTWQVQRDNCPACSVSRTPDRHEGPKYFSRFLFSLLLAFSHYF